jgi:hypothetical protein
MWRTDVNNAETSSECSSCFVSPGGHEFQRISSADQQPAVVAKGRCRNIAAVRVGVSICLSIGVIKKPVCKE